MEQNQSLTVFHAPVHLGMGRVDDVNFVGRNVPSVREHESPTPISARGASAHFSAALPRPVDAHNYP